MRLVASFPQTCPAIPSYRKANPADAPIFLIALTSDTMTVPQMYDAADSVLAQKVAQVQGVGQVFVWGSSQPAVRVEVNPTLLNKLGIGLDTVRTALNAANANRAKGEISGPERDYSIETTDQLFTRMSTVRSSSRITMGRPFGWEMWVRLRMRSQTGVKLGWQMANRPF